MLSVLKISVKYFRGFSTKQERMPYVEMSTHLSVTYQWLNRWTDILRIWYGIPSLKVIKQFLFCLQLDRNNGHFTLRTPYVSAFYLFIPAKKCFIFLWNTMYQVSSLFSIKQIKKANLSFAAFINCHFTELLFQLTLFMRYGLVNAVNGISQ